MTTTRAVAVLAGARDHFQLPLALAEGNDLQALVTDFYWPLDAFALGSILRSLLPERLARARYCDGLSSRQVIMDPNALTLAMRMYLDRQRDFNSEKDRFLGERARKVALRTGAGLFCYSYYAASAFLPQPEALPHRFLFQVHPHPVVVREILQEELDRVPRAKASLLREHELGLPEAQFERIAQEPYLANGWTVASTFTAKTLAARGVPFEHIHIVSYGVDLTAFPVRQHPPDASSSLTVIFVGMLTQRKGLSYLLDAIRLVNHPRLRVLLCGRGFVDEDLLSDYRDLAVEVHRGLPRSQLVTLLHQSDLMVLPSLVEGFAHVILEAMSCGVPVITTPNTCGPDVITEGVHGFIVPIRDPAAIAERLAWGIDNRQALAEMGYAAAAQARLFTWERFRAGIRQAYRAMLASVAGSQS